MASDLSQVKPGQKAQVLRLHGGQAEVDRLYAMGIRPGAVVTVKSAQPLHGPVVIKSGRGQWALGHGLAMKITVKVIA